MSCQEKPATVEKAYGKDFPELKKKSFSPHFLIKKKKKLQWGMTRRAPAHHVLIMRETDQEKTNTLCAHNVEIVRPGIPKPASFSSASLLMLLRGNPSLIKVKLNSAPWPDGDHQAHKERRKAWSTPDNPRKLTPTDRDVNTAR